MNNLEKLKEIVLSSKNVVFFGGAGVSTESGIPDFRSSTGFFMAGGFEDYSPEEILGIDFFYENTDVFYRYFLGNMDFEDCRPNKAHYALSELEDRGILKAVITQNIDGLHEKAHSKNIINLHGKGDEYYCTICDKKYSRDEAMEELNYKGVPECGFCQGLLRPSIVMYGESLDESLLETAEEYIKNADVLIVAGTSLVVEPAASLIQSYEGEKLIIINNSFTSYDSDAFLLIRESIGEALDYITR